MKKIILPVLLFCMTVQHATSQDEINRTVYFPRHKDYHKKNPSPKNTWVFLLAGQSNMAGRGFVEPQDTVPHKRIFAIDADGKLMYAKEPLNLFEPSYVGLDCGLSFAKSLLKNIPSNIQVLIVHTAVGGSNIRQWIDDSTHRNVKLLTNFKEKVAIAQHYGTIKGILWHQGESDATDKRIPLYNQHLQILFNEFRKYIGDDQLPILLGELGAFSKQPTAFEAINTVIRNYPNQDPQSSFIYTSDLQHKGDSLHFNSAGQRSMGERYAKAFAEKFLHLKK
jgi:hypothetical protein